jgi:hypothetical protein
MQSIPKIVVKRLQSPAADPHPDADLLTAFAERSLAARERDHVLEHLARCGDCREVIALALPATEAVAPASSPTTARIGWLTWPILRWGVVAAGIVSITSVGILQYRQRHQEKTLVATSLMSPDQSAETAAPGPVHTPPAKMGKQTEVEKKPSAPDAHNVLAINKPAPAPGAIPAPPQPMRHSYSAGASGGVAHGFASGIGRSSTAVEVSPKSDAEPAPADGLQALSKAKPVSDQASPDMAPAPLLRTDPALIGLAALRWTISSSGALQRSIDGGKTWLDVNVAADNSMSSKLVLRPQSATVEVQTEQTTQASTETNKTLAKSNANYAATSAVKSAAPPPPAPTIFRAVSVSSNAAEVWAGGSGGALYHTVDGGTSWARVVPSNAGILLTGDIIAVQFSDPRNGIVTTSNTEVWTTADAAQTWHKRQ